MTMFKFEWVSQYLPEPPSVIFDVGTWDGGDAVAFAHNWPMASVVAFEACPDNYAQITARGLLRSEGVDVYHLAVCDHCRGVWFTSNEDEHQGLNPGMSGSILPPTDLLKKVAPHLHFKQPRLVPSTRLDAFCRLKGLDHIDVLHMDVQGAEALVLRGLGELRPGLIFLETDETGEVGHYSGAALKTDLLELRNRMGYRVAWDSGHDQLWVHKALS